MPIFIEFMQEALQGLCRRMDFKAPPERQVRHGRGNREAFRPGHRAQAPPAPPVVRAGVGASRTATRLVPSGRRRRADAAGRRAAARPPKPPKQPDDLNGLY